jgi:decaprenyl-phosphate phosphoribosyltransferase
MQQIGYILKLIRVKQWLKNIFVALPLFFSLNFFKVDKLILCIETFFIVSFLASAVYVLNDYVDIENDKLHPVKKNRPLAAGVLSSNFAFVILFFALLLGLGGSYLLNQKLLLPAITYLSINVLYSFWLKKMPILDVSIIGIGFVLRVIIGAIAIDVVPSHWLIVMTFLFTVFIALAKRRDDLVILEQTQIVVRQTANSYSKSYLEHAMGILSACLILYYILYTTNPTTQEQFNSTSVFYSSFFVIVGVLRYWQIILIEQNSGSPTEIFIKDRFVQVNFICWILFLTYLIYF